MNNPFNPYKAAFYHKYGTPSEDTVTSYDTNTSQPDKVDDVDYDNCHDLDDDIDYMKSMYPIVIRKILREVEEQCDRLEYEGSCMFTQYPDRASLDAIINTIYEHVKDLDKDNSTLQTEELSFNPLRSPMPYRNCKGIYCRPPVPIPDYNMYGRPNWLRNLITVLLFDEMTHRRRRYRRRRQLRY